MSYECRDEITSVKHLKWKRCFKNVIMCLEVDLSLSQWGTVIPSTLPREHCPGSLLSLCLNPQPLLGTPNTSFLPLGPFNLASCSQPCGQKDLSKNMQCSMLLPCLNPPIASHCPQNEAMIPACAILVLGCPSNLRPSAGPHLATLQSLLLRYHIEDWNVPSPWTCLHPDLFLSLLLGFHSGVFINEAPWPCHFPSASGQLWTINALLSPWQ